MTNRDVEVTQYVRLSAQRAVQIENQATIIKDLRWRLHCRDGLCRRLVKVARAERKQRHQLESQVAFVSRGPIRFGTDVSV